MKRKKSGKLAAYRNKARLLVHEALKATQYAGRGIHPDGSESLLLLILAKKPCNGDHFVVNPWEKNDGRFAEAQKTSMLKNVFKPIFQLAASQINRLGIMDRVKFVTFNFDTIDRKMQSSDKWQLRNFLFRYRFSEWPLVPASKQLRNYGIFKLVDELSGVDGDFVEAGVGYGNSLLTMAYASAFFGVKRKIYGFDSFEGFPTPNAEDLGTRVTSLDAPPSGWNDTSPDMILRAFGEGWDLDPEKKSWSESIHLVPGFFEKTMPDKLPGKIALLHIDCDLYEPVLHVLNHCIGRMAAGGVIIFDEYHDPKWPGVKKAVDGFCSRHSLSVIFFHELRRYGIRIQGK